MAADDERRWTAVEPCRNTSGTFPVTNSGTRMLHTPRTRRGMVTSPHHLASQAGLAVLREGGNAIEAAIAAAATLAVVYPHMSGLGGDAYWLIAEPGKPPVSIDGSGAAGGGVTAGLYAGQAAMPVKGPLAATTVAGAVSAWHLARDVSAQWGGQLPLARLFADAIHAARDGFAVTHSQTEATHRLRDRLADLPHCAAAFLDERGQAPAVGSVMTLPAVAATLDRLAESGLDDFYRGEVARQIGDDLKAAGAPLRAEDLARHRGMRRRPLSLGLAAGTLFNTAPPTQGLASLILLGLYQRLDVAETGGFAWVHGLVEATKQAFRVRDAHLADPAHMQVHATTYLSDPLLDRMAARIDPTRAAPWPHLAGEGDTVWLGVIDGEGRAVSFIQSLFHAFGSGVVLPGTGIVWHNRGASFSLIPGHHNGVAPRKRPLHTLSPALARLKDGRVMVWGSMGGDAQPQVQAQVFTRVAMGGAELQEAISAPRFAFGRGRDGVPAADLKLEGRFAPEVVQALAAAGHDIALTGDFDAVMGHAGALIRRPDGIHEGAADPRSDGVVAGF